MNRIRQSLLSSLVPARRGAAAFALCLALIGIPSFPRAQTPADDVAAQIRAQGYACANPVTAERDIGRSRPDAPVWILRCQNASYSVRLHPDMAAEVSPIEP